MRLVLFICLLFIAACGKSVKVPEGVLPVPKMTEVLWDVMLADELVNLQYQVDTGTVKFDTSVVLYSQIVKAHNTTQKQFKQSLVFYKSRPDLMQVILDTLNNRATPPPVVGKDSTNPKPVPVE